MPAHETPTKPIMSIPPPAVERLLERAAELRAAGVSWEVVGQKLHRHRDTCSRWPRLYPEIWKRLVAATRAEQRQNAADEAMTVLRTLLRSDDEKIKRDVGRILFAGINPPQRRGPQTDDERIEEYCDDLDPNDAEQIDRILAAAETTADESAGEAGEA